jgi:hypothetical protein
MISRKQILSVAWRGSALAFLAGFALVGGACRATSQACSKEPLVDTLGASAEQARIDLQWLAIQGRLDSARSTADGIRTQRRASGSLDSSIARYRDSIRVDGSSVVSRSGCLDWRATWQAGRIDRPALATTWLRALVADSVGVVEWSMSDTTGVAWRLHVLYTRPGRDGGTLDSIVLALAPDRVQVDALHGSSPP